MTGSQPWALKAVIVVGVLSLLSACGDRPPVPPPTSTRTDLSGDGEGSLRFPLTAVTAHVATRLADESDSAFGGFTTGERDALRSLYETGPVRTPLWIDHRGRPNAHALVALALLDDAPAEGLDRADYQVDRLDLLSARLQTAQPPPAADAATLELGISLAMQRYFRHVHMGRIDPAALGTDMTAPGDLHDFSALLRSAVSAGRIVEAAAELRPRLTQYRTLRAALTRYRSLAANPGLEPLHPTGTTVRPGDRFFGARPLVRRLIAFGDLSPDTLHPSEPAVYEGALVAGVKRFQARHGLEDDGILGKATQSALQVSLDRRVRQIELALERLRWLPHLPDQRAIVVNIPTFRLWAWDRAQSDRSPSLDMGVIVGRALRNQTPLFVEEMRYVIFKPYWNVPTSILRNELLPTIEADPDYLQREGMEIVRGPGDAAEVVAVTAEHLAHLREGALRLRQRPGPKNALGLVKFVFPNETNIYMHGTPAQQLFSRPRRDFSHGCIRVEDPVALAKWVLRDQPEWTDERVEEAMIDSWSRQVNLTEPVLVILSYLTAVVRPEDGTVYFAEDIYGHDARLDEALTWSTETRAAMPH